MELWWPRTFRPDELLVSGRVQFSPPFSVTVTKKYRLKKKGIHLNKHAIFHIFLDGGAPLRYHTHPRPPGDVAPWVTWRPPWPRVRRPPPRRRGGMFGEPRGFRDVSARWASTTWWLLGTQRETFIFRGLFHPYIRGEYHVIYIYFARWAGIILPMLHRDNFRRNEIFGARNLKQAVWGGSNLMRSF